MPANAKGSKGTAVVLLVLAAVIVVIGVVNAAEGPTCGSQPMSPGDTCYFNGDPSSYQDRVTAARNAPLWNTAIAVVLVGCAIGSWVWNSGDGDDAASGRERRG